MSLPVDPPVDVVELVDPFDDEDRPLWSDSDPGPHDSLLGSDEEQELARRMRELQAAAMNRPRGARGSCFEFRLLGIQNFPGRPAGWSCAQPG